MQASSAYVLLKIGLESILLEIPEKSASERAALRVIIDQIQAELTSSVIVEGQSNEQEIPAKDINSYWPVLRQYLDSKYSIKIHEVALDTIQKMIANQLFKVDTPILVVKDEVNPVQTIRMIMDDLVDAIVHCYPLDIPAEDTVQLQIVKVFLALVTSPACIVHAKSLENILKICMLIHLQSKAATTCQVTAKAALMQMINMVFHKAEAQYEKISSLKIDIERQRKSRTEAENASTHDYAPSIASDMEVATSELSLIPSTHDTANVATTLPSMATSLDSPLITAEQVYLSMMDVSHVPSAMIGMVLPGSYGYCERCYRPASMWCISRRRPVCLQHGPAVDDADDDYIHGDLVFPEHAEWTHAFQLRSHELYLETLKEDCLIVLSLLFETLKKYERNGMNKAKILCYELILAILNNSGSCFRSDMEFLEPLQTRLCMSLSSNGLTNNIVLFELALGIFVILITDFRFCLKTQLEVLFNEIYLNAFKLSSITMHQRSLILQALVKICSEPSLLLDLYLNYDCDIDMECIYERIILTFATVLHMEDYFKSQTKGISYDTSDGAVSAHYVAILESLLPPGWNAPECNMSKKSEGSSTAINTALLTDSSGLYLLALKGLASIVRSLISFLPKRESDEANTTTLESQQSKAVEKDDFTGSDTDEESDFTTLPSEGRHGSMAIIQQHHIHLKQISDSKTKKKLLRQGISLFNTSRHAYDGIKFLTQNGLLDGDNVSSVSKFLHNTPGIDKVALGAFLGEPDSRSIVIMHAFIDLMDLSGYDFVKALRLLLYTFRLPGEAQKIDRIMEKFADRYCECNPGTFSNADIAYTLAYSVIMLNTDLHSNQVKVKMTKESFIKNNRNIHSSGSSEVTDQMLSLIYDDILQDEIILKSDSRNETATVQGYSQAAQSGHSDWNIIQVQLFTPHSASFITQSKGMPSTAIDNISSNLTKRRSELRLQEARPAIEYISSCKDGPNHMGNISDMLQILTLPMLGSLYTVFIQCQTPSSPIQEHGHLKREEEQHLHMIRAALQCFLDMIHAYCTMPSMEQNNTFDLERQVYVSKLYELSCGPYTHLNKTHPNLVSFSGLKKIWAIKLLLCIVLEYGHMMGVSEWICACKSISILDRNCLIDAPILTHHKPVQTADTVFQSKDDMDLSKRRHIVWTRSSKDPIALVKNGSDNLVNVTHSMTLFHHSSDVFSSNSKSMSSAVHTRHSSLSEKDKGTNVNAYKLPFSFQFSLRSKRPSTSILAWIQGAVQDQDIPRIMDSIFTNSIMLPSKTVIYLFQSLCYVSTEELGLECITPLAPGLGISATVKGEVQVPSQEPRIFSLQKIVETAYYNMDRIRLEWGQIWKVLQPHFNRSGLHPQLQIGTLAIDALRQLTVRFLERDELCHYATQNDLVKSFEYIMKHTTFHPIKEQILSLFDQMISTQAPNIKSGWKTIMSVLSKSATQTELQASSLSLLQKIHHNCFEELILSTGCFSDFVHCLTDLTCMCSPAREDIASGALRLLQGCHTKLLTITFTPSSNNNSVADGGGEEFHFRWYPLLMSFPRIILEASKFPYIQSQAVDILFQTLIKTKQEAKTSVVWIGKPSYWRTIYKSMLFPIFEDLLTENEYISLMQDWVPRPGTSPISPVINNRGSDVSQSLIKGQQVPSSTWIHVLRLWVDLISTYPDQLLIFNIEDHQAYPFLRGFLGLLDTCVRHQDEHLAQSCILCFYYIIEKNQTCRLLQENPESWKCIIEAILRLFYWTLPKEELISIEQIGKSITPDDFHAVTWKCSLHLGLIHVIRDVHSLCFPSVSTQDDNVLSRLFHQESVCLESILTALRASMDFSREFHSNTQLREQLARVGGVGSIQGIVLRKQQFQSWTEYMCILMHTVHFCTSTDQGVNWWQEDEEALCQKVVEPLASSIQSVFIEVFELMHAEKDEADNRWADLTSWLSLIKFVLDTLSSMDIFYDESNSRVQDRLRILMKYLLDQCFKFISIRIQIPVEVGDHSLMARMWAEANQAMIEFIQIVQGHFLKI